MSHQQTNSIVDSPGLIIIPARLNSSRLPQKLLLAETGRELLLYAIDIARRAVSAAPTLLCGPIVAADSESLVEVAKLAGADTRLTGSEHPHGTSRITEVVRKFSPDIPLPPFVINLQADHPEIAPEVLIQVSQALLTSPLPKMATAAVPLDPSDNSALGNPNVVKVSCDSDDLARDFFRQCTDIRSSAPSTCFRHLGIYAYRTEFLLRLAESPPSSRAIQADLEQLTPLDLDAAIRVVVVPESFAGYGIDAPADYTAFVQRIKDSFSAQDGEKS